jgi:hypothetical protein
MSSDVVLGKSLSCPSIAALFGVKEEGLLKYPKQGLDKICIGIDIR